MATVGLDYLKISPFPALNTPLKTSPPPIQPPTQTADMPTIFWFGLIAHLAILGYWTNYQKQQAIAQFVRQQQPNSQIPH